MKGDASININKNIYFFILGKVGNNYKKSKKISQGRIRKNILHKH